jgi:hypothetical protein
MTTTKTEATYAVAQTIATRLMNTSTTLTYWACRQRLDSMSRGARNAAIISGMCNVRTLHRAVAEVLTNKGRGDLAECPVMPTPQQAVWLNQIDSGTDINIAHGRTMRSCRDRQWAMWTGRRWMLTDSGRDAARGERDYWRP